MAAVETTGIVGSPVTRTYQAGVANMGRGIAVTQGADDNHVIPCGANQQPIGILEEATYVVGQSCAVVVEGEAVIVAGAPIVAPAYLISNASGQLVPSAAVGDQVAGYAVSSASLAGDYAVARVRPFIR